MNLKLCAVLSIFLAICRTCAGLRCHLCSHSKSWDYCERYGSTVSCPSSSSKIPMCYSLKKHKDYLNNTRDYYFSRGCIYKDHCTVPYMCTNKDECQLICCTENLCNGSPMAGEYGTKTLWMLMLSVVASLFSIEMLN
ncbi:uncharacterized protein LOC135686591 [Rhopilema esculentum]|uniref:uncharacterized protein LOC135686591 n=1 Tax=Rhopilema esculentum TaxID=499914 RepID=UPI0031D52831|eukprot:gene273-9921_t